MNQIKVDAAVEQLAAVLEFVHQQFAEDSCSPRWLMQLDLALEELFVNIANYAYAPETGTATISAGMLPDAQTLEVTLIDSGTPYDPLARKDPNVNIPLQDRVPGGLGIFLAKKNTDALQYAYRDGCNVLTFRKKLEGNS